MFPEHTRAGVAHDNSGALTAIVLVAMHWAIGARGLFFAKATPLQPESGIIQKMTTIGA